MRQEQHANSLATISERASEWVVRIVVEAKQLVGLGTGQSWDGNHVIWAKDWLFVANYMHMESWVEFCMLVSTTDLGTLPQKLEGDRHDTCEAHEMASALGPASGDGCHRHGWHCA